MDVVDGDEKIIVVGDETTMDVVDGDVTSMDAAVMTVDVTRNTLNHIFTY